MVVKPRWESQVRCQNNGLAITDANGSIEGIWRKAKGCLVNPHTKKRQILLGYRGKGCLLEILRDF